MIKDAHHPFHILQALVQGIYSADPLRTYHNWQHVQECHAAAKQATQDKVPLSVELAIMYHDAIYVPGFRYNEEASATLLLSHCRAHGLNVDYLRTIQAAASCIRDTYIANHMSKTWKPKSIESALVNDCDLSSLADLNWKRFINRQDRIIAEQQGLWVIESTSKYGAEQLRKHRLDTANFLRSFTLKPKIYHTDGFTLDEEIARDNIERYFREYGSI